MLQFSHPTTTEKTMALTLQTFVSKVIALFLNMLSRFVIAFLPRSKCLWILWLLLPSAVILEPKKNDLSLFPLFPFYLPGSDGTRCHDLRFLMLSFKATLSLSSSILIKRLFSLSLLSAVWVVSSAYLGLLFLPAILSPECDWYSLTFHMM